ALLWPLQTDWTLGCLPPLREELALLALAVVTAACVRTQLFLWICGLVWTCTLCTWCTHLGTGTCAGATLPRAWTPAVLGAPARSAAPELPPRTDAEGRWPAPPSASTPAPTPASASTPGSAPSDVPPEFPRISLDQASRDPDLFFARDGARIYVP